MKRTLFVALTASFLLAQSLPMPPMMPPMPSLQSASSTSSKSSNSPKRMDSSIKNQLPQECKTIPPMLILLPPPLEKDLQKCKNRMYLPTKQKAKEALSKLLRIKRVEIAKGFDMLYKISTNWGTFYCNKDLSVCIQGKEQ